MDPEPPGPHLPCRNVFWKSGKCRAGGKVPGFTDLGVKWTKLPWIKQSYLKITKGWTRVSASVDHKPSSVISDWKRIQCLLWDAHLSCLCQDQKELRGEKTGNQWGTHLVYEESNFPNRKTSKAQSKCLDPWETMISSANLTTECIQKTPNEDNCRELKV